MANIDYIQWGKYIPCKIAITNTDHQRFVKNGIL